MSESVPLKTTSSVCGRFLPVSFLIDCCLSDTLQPCLHSPVCPSLTRTYKPIQPCVSLPCWKTRRNITFLLIHRFPSGVAVYHFDILSISRALICVTLNVLVIPDFQKKKKKKKKKVEEKRREREKGKLC